MQPLPLWRCGSDFCARLCVSVCACVRGVACFLATVTQLWTKILFYCLLSSIFTLIFSTSHVCACVYECMFIWSTVSLLKAVSLLLFCSAQPFHCTCVSLFRKQKVKALTLDKNWSWKRWLKFNAVLKKLAEFEKWHFDKVSFQNDKKSSGEARSKSNYP